MALTTTISTFITDAKAKVITLTNEMQSLSRRDSSWHKKYDQKKKLLWFMEIVQPVDGPSSGDNFLNAAGWTDDEIEREIYYWRAVTGMNKTFDLHYKTY